MLEKGRSADRGNINIPIVSNVVFTSDVSKGTLARLVSALEVGNLLSHFVPQLGVVCMWVQTVVVYHEIKGRVDKLAQVEKPNIDVATAYI